jgi:hypothetical protein
VARPRLSFRLVIRPHLVSSDKAKQFLLRVY